MIEEGRLGRAEEGLKGGKVASAEIPMQVCAGQDMGKEAGGSQGGVCDA